MMGMKWWNGKEASVCERLGPTADCYQRLSSSSKFSGSCVPTLQTLPTPHGSFAFTVWPRMKGAWGKVWMSPENTGPYRLTRWNRYFPCDFTDPSYSLWLGSHDIRDTKWRTMEDWGCGGASSLGGSPSLHSIITTFPHPTITLHSHSSRDTRCDCKEVSVDREWMWWGAPMDAFLSYHSAAGGPCERQTEWHTGWTTGGGMDHAPLTRHERREQWTRDAWRLNERKEWCMLSIWSHGSFLSSSYCRASLRVHVARPTRVSCLHAWPTEGEWKW